MKMSGNGEQLQAHITGIEEKIQAEQQTRVSVQDGMQHLEARMDQLASSLANSTQPTSSVMNSTFAHPRQPIIHPVPSMYNNFNAHFTTPRMQVPNIPAPIPMPAVNPQLYEFNMLRSQFTSLQKQYSESERSLNDLYDEITYLKKSINERDQYDRRNNLIWHGLDDVPLMPSKPTQKDQRKFTKYVVDKVNELLPGIEGGFSARDIDDCHIYRTKRHNPKSHKQLLIIRFCSRLVRNEIFSMKKSLKGTGVSITEHLTAANLQLLKAAQGKLGNKNKAWTHYGKVLIDLNGTIKAVHSYDDLEYYLG